MDPSVKQRKGCYYRNEVWFSKAYQALSNAARDLLQCLYTELQRSLISVGKKKGWEILNNGEVSFTEIDFKRLTGKSSETYKKARNKLIEVGFIRQTYRGGNYRGDRARYEILVETKLPKDRERWRRYPTENWAHEVPAAKNQLIGKNTRWKSGQCGRKKIHPNS